MSQYTTDHCRAHLQLSFETLAYRNDPAWVNSDAQLKSDIISIFCIERFLDKKNIDSKKIKQLLNAAKSEASKKVPLIDKHLISTRLISLLNATTSFGITRNEIAFFPHIFLTQ